MTDQRQLPLQFDHRPSLSGEDFIVAPCNRDAVAWLDHWPDWPSPFLVIYGEAACGKTHLAQVFSKATGAKEIDLALDPYEALGSQPAAILEDVDQKITGHEDALFHLYNHARETKACILLTSRKAPSDWPVTLKDLQSRLGAVCVAQIGSPDDTLMETILVKLFSDRQLNVEKTVIQFILSRMERSFEAAADLVARIDQEALVLKRKITIPLVKKLIN